MREMLLVERVKTIQFTNQGQQAERGSTIIFAHKDESQQPIAAAGAGWHGESAIELDITP